MKLIFMLIASFMHFFKMKHTKNYLKHKKYQENPPQSTTAAADITPTVSATDPAAKKVSASDDCNSGSITGIGSKLSSGWAGSAGDINLDAGYNMTPVQQVKNCTDIFRIT